MGMSVRGHLCAKQTNLKSVISVRTRMLDSGELRAYEEGQNCMSGFMMRSVRVIKLRRLTFGT